MTYDELTALHDITLSRLKRLYMRKGAHTQSIPGFQWEKYLADGWKFIGDVDADEVMRMYDTLGPPSTDVNPLLIWLRAYHAWGEENPEAYQQKIMDDIKRRASWVLCPDLLGVVIPSNDAS